MIAYESGSTAIARFLGDTYELRNPTTPLERNKDLWNNNFGRNAAQGATSEQEIIQRIVDGIANGELIITPTADPRADPANFPSDLLPIPDGPMDEMAALEFGDIESFEDLFDGAQVVSPPPPSPLILDLDGDGIETTGLTDGAYFDHDGNGFAQRTAWAGTDDGLLVWDRNEDGRISSGAELCGNETILEDQSKAAHGFEALTELDANSDGKIDSSDSEWANLKVWKDLDGDGSSTEDELFGLSEVGVQSINVGYTNSTFIDENGHEHRQVGTFTRTDNTTGSVADVWFQQDLKYTIAGEYLEVPTAIAALPNLLGFGNVYELHQAIIRDASGDLQELVESFVSQTDPEDRDATLEQILFKWTGSDLIDPSSRGSNIDARKLSVLEEFLGREFVGNQGPNPIPAAAVLLNQSYQGMYEMFHAQLMAQTDLAFLYEQITYSWNEAAQTVVCDLSDVKNELLDGIALDIGAGEAQALALIRSVKGLATPDTLSVDQLRGDEALDWLLDSYGMQKIDGTSSNDVLAGTANADAIRGGIGDDSISAGNGNNVLYGNGGFDTISAGFGNDLIYGGGGNDHITDNGGLSTIDGGDGADTIATSGSDLIYGGGGDDIITDTGGTNIL
jgi:Ca2+-binding RTX toxin-like protein